MEPADNQVSRMLHFLANYQFEVRHLPGSKHGNADALSRAPHVRNSPPAAVPLGTDEEWPGIQAMVVRDEHSHPVLTSPEQFRRHQINDEDLSAIRTWLKQDAPPSNLDRRRLSPAARLYLQLWDGLFFDSDDVLCYNHPSYDRSPRQSDVSQQIFSGR